MGGICCCSWKVAWTCPCQQVLGVVLTRILRTSQQASPPFSSQALGTLVLQGVRLQVAAQLLCQLPTMQVGLREAASAVEVQLGRDASLWEVLSCGLVAVLEVETCEQAVVQQVLLERQLAFLPLEPCRRLVPEQLPPGSCKHTLRHDCSSPHQAIHRHGLVAVFLVAERTPDREREILLQVSPCGQTDRCPSWCRIRGFYSLLPPLSFQSAPPRTLCGSSLVASPPGSVHPPVLVWEHWKAGPEQEVNETR